MEDLSIRKRRRRSTIRRVEQQVFGYDLRRLMLMASYRVLNAMSIRGRLLRLFVRKNSIS